MLLQCCECLCVGLGEGVVVFGVGYVDVDVEVCGDFVEQGFVVYGEVECDVVFGFGEEYCCFVFGVVLFLLVGEWVGWGVCCYCYYYGGGWKGFQYLMGEGGVVGEQ